MELYEILPNHSRSVEKSRDRKFQQRRRIHFVNSHASSSTAPLTEEESPLIICQLLTMNEKKKNIRLDMDYDILNKGTVQKQIL